MEAGNTEKEARVRAEALTPVVLSEEFPSDLVLTGITVAYSGVPADVVYEYVLRRSVASLGEPTGTFGSWLSTVGWMSACSRGRNCRRFSR